ncbi:MAG: polyprenyl synthetase family protein, partial [Salinisphaera sp.]|nr:polyprenyl synthetase family protein [Salinisphaera sp.]
SVLTGDFLYSRSFQMMVELQRMEVMQVLSAATNRIAEGEVLQLMHAHNPEISEANYLEVIDRKTATLFAAGCRLAAALADAPEGHKTALQAYGRHLGLAFQLIDDALDYDADSPQFGKNVGDDLAEGKVTLPLIRALEIADPVRAEALRAAIRSGDNGKLDMVRETIESTQAMTYTCARADDEIQQALAALDGIPDSSSKTALQQLAEFSIRRSF